MPTKKGGLGAKGLSALFSDNNNSERVEVGADAPIQDIDVTKIIPNPDQPRKTFNDDSLKELSTSIATYGVLQPLLISPTVDDKYLIVAGERRYRASLLAGRKTVPAIIRVCSPQEVREIALVENLHREDLNAIESAEAMRELMENYSLTQEQVAAKINKSRPYVTNTLRLLQLPKEVTDLVRDGSLSPGHARALISIDDKDYLIRLAKKTIDKKMSVRDLEREVRLYFTRQNIASGPRKKSLTLELNDFKNDMRRIFGTKVTIKGNEKTGRIMIDYFTADDLDRIFKLMNELKKFI